MITHQRQNNAGFSLIELSVVMVIVSILLVGVLQAYRIYDEKSKIERMNILMTTLDQNLVSFLKKEGRLPCPAPVDGAAAGNNFDSESCSGALNVAGTSGGRVLIGKIPAASLGLSNDYMRDTYGSYITYAVTEAATTSASGVVGAIRVREENIDRTAGSSTFGELIELENHTNVAYLFVSAGRSKEGAFTHEGTRLNCSSNKKDRENCNDDGVFTASLLSDVGPANNANFYDDRIVFKRDSDVSGADAKVLKIGREGRDFDRVPVSRGVEEIHMKKDGYFVTTVSGSGGSPNARNGSSTMMTPLKEGDVISGGAVAVSNAVRGGVGVTLNGTSLLSIGGRTFTHNESGRNGPGGQYLFSNEYSGNGQNISQVPTVAGSYSCSGCGGGNQGDGYDYSGSYTGYVWVE